MADPTLQLDANGEVRWMKNRGADPKIRAWMTARDSKEEPVLKEDPDFEYYANLTEEELSAEFEKLTKLDIMSTLNSIQLIRRTQVLLEA